MRRILLLGMAVLLGLAAHADDRQIVFEETFAEGLGDFTVDIEQNDDGISTLWEYNSAGYIHATNVVNGETHKSTAWLISPLIDLTHAANAIFSFDYKAEATNSLSRFVTVWIKVEGEDWTVLRQEFYLPEHDDFIHSRKFYLNRYQGKQIKIGFRFQSFGTFEEDYKIRNIKIDGIPTESTTVSPVQVNGIAEFLALPENTFAEVTLDGAEVIWQDYDLLFLKDNTACMSLSVGSWSQLSEWGGERSYTGVLSGVRTKQFGYNEMSDGKSDIVPVWFDMMDGPHEVPANYIEQEQISDFDCARVRLTYKNSSFKFLDYTGQKFDKIRGKEYSFDNSLFIDGVVYMTPEQEIRIIPYSEICFVLKDDDPYIYNNRLGEIGLRLYRPLKKDQWNTLSLPFELNSNRSSLFSNSNYRFAVLSYISNGVIYFNTISPSNSKRIAAGTPFLVRPPFDNDDYIYVSQNTSSTQYNYENITGNSILSGDYRFVGTLEPVQPADGSYYLSANNTIRPLASGGTIKGFRAYFEPATPNAAQARAISIDGVTTAIEDIVGGEELLGIPQKVYTVNGQYAGDDFEALPKGVYIVNGKKIIK
jgi:hypothetical protein